MKSQTIIMILCWIALLLDWTTDVLPHPDLASAMIWSWIILWLFGFFKREEATAVPDEQDQLSERQVDFMRKLEEGKLNIPDFDEEELQARIITVDEDGNQSTVIIKDDGTIETEGNVDPDIIEAVKMLTDSVKEHGPEAIAEELGRQIEKIKNGEK